MCVIIAGLLLTAAPAASAQKQPAPPPPPKQAQAPTTQPPRVVVIEPVRVFDPYFDYPYPYAYEPEYMSQNFGYVKIKTDHKDAAVYVDGGYADRIEKAKKFALRPGTHDIELRDSDGRTLVHEKVAVIVGKTTEIKV
jgi:hypothetical protein